MISIRGQREGTAALGDRALRERAVLQLEGERTLAVRAAVGRHRRTVVGIALIAPNVPVHERLLTGPASIPRMAHHAHAPTTRKSSAVTPKTDLNPQWALR